MLAVLSMGSSHTIVVHVEDIEPIDVSQGRICTDTVKQREELGKLLKSHGVSGHSELFLGLHPITTLSTKKHVAKECLLRGLGAHHHEAPSAMFSDLSPEEWEDFLTLQLDVLENIPESQNHGPFTVNCSSDMLTKLTTSTITRIHQNPNLIVELTDWPTPDACSIMDMLGREKVWLDDVKPKYWSELPKVLKKVSAVKIDYITSLRLLHRNEARLACNLINEKVTEIIQQDFDKLSLQGSFRDVVTNVRNENGHCKLIFECSCSADELRKYNYIQCASDSAFIAVQGQEHDAVVQRITVTAEIRPGAQTWQSTLECCHRRSVLK